MAGICIAKTMNLKPRLIIIPKKHHASTSYQMQFSLYPLRRVWEPLLKSSLYFVPTDRTKRLHKWIPKVMLMKTRENTPKCRPSLMLLKSQSHLGSRRGGEERGSHQTDCMVFSLYFTLWYRLSWIIIYTEPSFESKSLQIRALSRRQHAVLGHCSFESCAGIL
jgi:hypothetical protein